MEPPPATVPLPPLLAAVRRRHPDVDVVVLPAGDPGSSGRPTGVVGDAEVAAALRLVDETATGLGEAVGCRPPPSVLRHGPVRGTVRARAHCSLVRTDGSARLQLLSRTLSEQGWQVRRPPGAVQRLVARSPGLVLRASWAESTGAFLLDLSSGLLMVGDHRARALVNP